MRKYNSQLSAATNVRVTCELVMQQHRQKCLFLVWFVSPLLVSREQPLTKLAWVFIHCTYMSRFLMHTYAQLDIKGCLVTSHYCNINVYPGRSFCAYSQLPKQCSKYSQLRVGGEASQAGHSQISPRKDAIKYYCKHYTVQFQNLSHKSFFTQKKF